MVSNFIIRGVRLRAPFFILRGFALVFITCLLACSEPTFRIHEKLDEIAQGDLQFIVAEIKAGSGTTHLLSEPFFVVKDLRFFSGDSARIFVAYAEIDFHYFSDIELIQKRKYRYLKAGRQWDRYYKNFARVKEVRDIQSYNK